MKTLFVLRHAKSSWANPNQTDFERPLNERGETAAPKMGLLMRGNNFAPDLIIASPAVRTQQTAELVKQAANFTAEISFEARIYEASTSDLLAVAREISDDYEKVLLVGHNSGMENLIWSLTGERREMPTAALAVIELRAEKWREVGANGGLLRDLFKPKEIAEN